MQAGARGYLTKRAGPSACLAAIRAVAAGRVHLAADLTDALATHRDGGVRTRGVLSGREQQALAYIARGFTHQQTATRMGVSKATVDTYVGRIRGKLRLGNKAELALAALRYVEPGHAPG
jgi:DNA-binding NarL/FixJ family response regulator